MSPDRYRRILLPGYVRVELILDEELFRWADRYAAETGASPEAAIEAALRQYRAERGAGEVAGEQRWHGQEPEVGEMLEDEE